MKEEEKALERIQKSIDYFSEGKCQDLTFDGIVTSKSNSDCLSLCLLKTT